MNEHHDKNNLEHNSNVEKKKINKKHLGGGTKDDNSSGFLNKLPSTFNFKKKLRRFKKFKLTPKLKKIIFISLALLLAIILVFGIARLYLTLNVLLGHDVLIDLRTNQDYFSVQNNEVVNIEFRTSVRTNPFCSAVCEYNFVDLSNGEIIDSGEYLINALIPKENKYEVSNSIGERSKLYRFEISCMSERTNLCRTTEESRARYLVVSVEYRLDDNQIFSKNQSKVLYNEFSEGLIESMYKTEGIKRNFNELSEYYVLSNRTTIFDRTLSELENTMNVFFSTWKSEQYEKLNDMMNENKNDFRHHFKLISEEFNSTKQRIELHNNMTSKLFEIRNITLSFDNLIMYNQSLKDNIINVSGLVNDSIVFFNERNSISTTNKNIENISLIAKELYSTANYYDFLNRINISESLNLFEEFLCESINCTYEYINMTNMSREFLCDKIYFSYINKSNHNITNIYLPDNCTGLNISLVNITPNKIDFIDVFSNELIIDINDDFFMDFGFSKELPRNEEMCCVLGNCQPCCYSKDCTGNPIIFIHGHAIDHRTPPDYSMDAFTRLQVKLETEDILNFGRISLYNYFELPENIWGRFGWPISLKISYYYDIYTEDESSIIVPTKNENLETYAVRLKEIIDSVLYKTNSSQAVLFAHSMGGLVTRRYMQIFGTDNVEKVMLLGTPNHGTVGIISDLCPLFGERLECRDLRQGSLFLNKLNSGPFPDISLYNVVAIGCEMREGDGDGVVIKDSAWLDGAQNFIVEGECETGRTFHTEFIKDVQNSEFFEIVRDFLMN